MGDCAKDYDSTIAYFSNALDQFGKYKSVTEKWQIYTLRGFSYIAKRDFENGLADLDKAVEILPDDPRGYINLASFFCLRGIEVDDRQRHKNAVVYFEQRNKEMRDQYARIQKRGIQDKDHKGLISDSQTTLDILTCIMK